MILNHKMFINSLRAKDYAILLGLLLLLHETFRMQLSVYCVDTNTKTIHFLPEILLCFSNIFLFISVTNYFILIFQEILFLLKTILI